MNPRITDNDNGRITASLNGQELRSWGYASDEHRRQKMLQAREYVEGWCHRARRDIPPSGKVEPLPAADEIASHRAQLAEPQGGTHER